MTHSSPPEPPSRQDSLGFDDVVGVFVAIAGIGAILFWSIRDKTPRFSLPSFAPIVTSPSPTLSPTPTSSPTPNAQFPGSTTTASPQALIQPSPQPTPQTSIVPFVPVPAPTASVSAAATGFVDVPSNFWAAPFIGPLVQQNRLEGFSDGTFRPNLPVTRSEFALMLQKAFDSSGNRQTPPFKDMPSGDRTHTAIVAAVQSGFMKGYPDNTFRPEQQIPKAQVLIALVSGLGLPNPPDPAQVVDSYQDAAQIPPYAIDKVAAATVNGLVVNYPDLKLLKPNQVATRADAAALIYQTLVKAGKVDQVASPYLVQP